MSKDNKLNFLSIGLMYVGSVVGAGFASGREIWQFFGMFTENAIKGVALTGIFYVVFGLMVTLIAQKGKTCDIGELIVPGNNRKLINLIGYFVAVILLTTIVSMFAAGGALVSQQFGINTLVGSIVLMIAVVATVIGGFNRLSKMFKMVMPVLLFIVIGTALIVIFSDLPKGTMQGEVTITGLTDNWAVSSFLYMSYNLMAIIPILGTASINAKNTKHAIGGALLGSFFLCVMVLVVCKAMLTDPGYSHVIDMPMLAIAGKLGKGAGILYAVVLMFAIYSSCSSNFYGFTTKLKEDKNKNKKIILCAIAGLVCSMAGFKTIVAYLYSGIGVLGIGVIAMITVNFIRKVIIKR